MTGISETFRRAYYTECSRDGCGKDGEERYSLGIYAGRYCDEHWKTSGYRKEGRSGFDQADAGEQYEADEW